MTTTYEVRQGNSSWHDAAAADVPQDIKAVLDARGGRVVLADRRGKAVTSYRAKAGVASATKTGICSTLLAAWAGALSVVPVVVLVVPSKVAEPSLHTSCELLWLFAIVFYLGACELRLIGNSDCGAKGVGLFFMGGAKVMLAMREAAARILTGAAIVAAVVMGLYMGVAVLTQPPKGDPTVGIWLTAAAFISSAVVSVVELAMQFRTLEEDLGNLTRGALGVLAVIIVFLARDWGHWSWRGLAVGIGLVLAAASVWHWLLDPEGNGPANT